MDASDMLEYEYNVIDAFKNGIFLSEHLKTDDAAHDHVLEDVIILFRKLN